AATPPPPTTVNFSPTGASQSWTVPAGVTSATFDVFGAGGFLTQQFSFGGKGGEATATIPVTPGETLTMNVGDAGAASGSAFGGGGTGIDSGGGGGGASDVRRGPGLADRLIVGGGGGGIGDNGAAADGGGPVGGTAFSLPFTHCGRPGGGGTQDA